MKWQLAAHGGLIRFLCSMDERYARVQYFSLSLPPSFKKLFGGPGLVTFVIRAPYA